MAILSTPEVHTLDQAPALGLAEQAYRLIRRRIITSELPPGAVLHEQNLARELGLGRTPVREALQRLGSDGLVRIVPRRATIVTSVTFTDLQKVVEIREELEGLCGRLAAERITPEQLARMDTLVSTFEDSPDSDLDPLLTLDEPFHDLVYEASANEYLAESLRYLYALSARMWYLVLPRLGDIGWAMEANRPIADALRMRNGLLVERLLRNHVREFHKAVKRTL